MSYKYKIGFFGGGVMATSIIKRLIDSKTLLAENIIVADPSDALAKEYVTITKDNSIVLNDCEYIILAIKPQTLGMIKDDLAKACAKCVISIMAGVKISTLQQIIPNNIDIIRVMPNLPSKVAMGMTCITDNNTEQAHKDFAINIFNQIGVTEIVKEDLFDAVTSISGSGPAYVFMFINALTKAGVEGGLSEKTAKILATQTLAGACKMVEHDPDADISRMVDAVCSKGGTTIEAVKSFVADDLDGIVSRAVKACRERSIELSKA